MFANVLASCIYVMILNVLTFMSFVLLGTHIFIDKSSAVLQLSIHLSGLTTGCNKCAYLGTYVR